MIKGIHYISMKCGRVEELTNVRKFYIETLGFAISDEGMNFEAPVAINKGCSRSSFCNVFPNGSFSNSHRTV